MAIEKQNIESSFDEFINQYKSDKMSVLVGAGLSMNVSDKFLSWRVLVKDMVEYVYKDKIELHCENYIHIHGNKTNIEDIKSLYIETILDNEDFLQLASKYIRKKGYREAMEYYIEERTPKLDFSSENNEIELNTIKGTVGTIFESDLSVHKALLGCRRFQNIYTTNYDNIIEFTSELLKNEDSKIAI